MCWKYENHYSYCFDLIFKDVFWQDENGLNALLREWGVKILDEERLEEKFFEFLSICHEEKIIDGKECENRLETWAEELERKNNLKK